jgi:hypothetical protein
VSDIKVHPTFRLKQTFYEGKDKARRKSHVVSDLRPHQALVAAVSSGSTAVSGSSMGSVMSSLVDPDVVYTFRFVNSSTVTASGGIWNGSVNLDPTATSEWSSVSNLFQQYRLRFARATIVPAPDTNGTGKSNPFVAAGIHLGEITTSPGTLSAAFAVPDGRIISLDPGMPHRDYQWSTGDISKRFEFQLVGAAGTPYAGAYGLFWYYGFANLTSSTFQVALEIEVDMRGRA